jgi:aspartate kinase
MSIIVQKFGGTSLADADKILSAARKAIAAQQAGHQVVMVVSAMGKNTDTLVELANQIHPRPPAREMDALLSTGEQVSASLMAMAINSLGHQAVSLSGAQIGIRTDSTHTKARIISISTSRIEQLLDDGNIVIAAGFQGIDENQDITTLGRGGSDTTAVALAAVLGAARCQIYTDVDGVYTTDPRLVESAQRLNQLSYDEMLELASLGAGVMHSRSIEFAKNYSVPVQVSSSMTDNPGTMIHETSPADALAVCGAVLTANEARITLARVPDVPGASHEIFSRIAEHKVAVDMIVQNVGDAGLSDLSFTVPDEELEQTLEALEEARQRIQISQILVDTSVAKVSVVGAGMANQTGVAEKMFHTLAAVDVNILMITTSQIKISVLVARDQAKQALLAIHQAFELDQLGDNDRNSSVVAMPPQRADQERADVVARLRDTGMEELVIDDISLDRDQSRITLQGIPDQPGTAARLFREVAAANILVDMIIQSYLQEDGIACISFTVPRDDREACIALCQKLANDLPCEGVSSSPSVAKLSVSGVGLRSHTGVAARMFQALADAGINIELTNTSEVRVNVIVDDEHGDAALAGITRVFAPDSEKDATA